MEGIDDEMTGPAPIAGIVAAMGDDTDSVRADVADKIHVELVTDGDEWLVEEAGYGYGV